MSPYPPTTSQDLYLRTSEKGHEAGPKTPRAPPPWSSSSRCGSPKPCASLLLVVIPAQPECVLGSKCPRVSGSKSRGMRAYWHMDAVFPYALGTLILMLTAIG